MSKNAPRWVRKVMGVALIAAGLFAVQATLQAAKPAPDQITIQKFKATKGAVPFSHKKHADLAGGDAKCSTCHHTTKAGEDVKACTECHKAAAEGKTPDAKTAFHASCQGCHKKVKAEKPDSKVPGMACGGCHK